MVPLLLLLLLQESLADQVCVNVSNYDVVITGTRANIHDNWNNSVTCKRDGLPCYFQCTFTNMTRLNESSVCFEANVTRNSTTYVYSIQKCGIWTEYLCDETTILPLIQSLDRESSDQKEMMQLFSMRDSCAQLFSSNHEVKKAFINVEKQMIHNIMGTSQVEAGYSKSYSLKALSLNVVNISEAVLSSTGETSTVQIEAPQLLPQNNLFVPETWLPVSALHSIPKKERIIGLVSYMRHSQFHFEPKNISSMVIRIMLLGKRRLHNLKTPIKMMFRVTTPANMDNDSRLLCHYFDEHDYLWKTDGCETYSSTDTNIVCKCDHATAFAVLLIREPIAEAHWKILSYISYIGCGLSAFFTALSFVIYAFSRPDVGVLTAPSQQIICAERFSHEVYDNYNVIGQKYEVGVVNVERFMMRAAVGGPCEDFKGVLQFVRREMSRNHRMDYSTSIHVSLSGALFLLNVTFLLTEWGATVRLDWVCVLVAALMHYSLLCCFTWMAIEALHLYLLLVKVFNTHYKHYLLKLSLAGWGIPGVIVAVSLGVKDFKQFYGVTQMKMTDTNQTNSICWITDDSFFYSLNLVYFTLIFVFNSGILMAVASSICKMKQVLKANSKFATEAKGKSWIDPERFSASCRSGLTLLGLTCLMGTTWGLAFLGSGYINYPILYLFCILNSTQGFFIFLWICLSAKKQRKRDMEDRMTLTPVKTSGLKSD